MLSGYFARLPLTDRITFAREIWAAVFYGVFAGLALPLIPIVARRIGMSPAGITVMVTMQFIGALFGILFGHMADRRKKIPFVIWPAITGRLMIGLLAFAQSSGVYLLLVSVFFLTVNLGGPAYASIMRSNYSDANRGRLMGDIRMVIVIVAAGFSALAGILLGRDESIVRWLFLAASVFGILSSVAFARIRVRMGPDFPRDAPSASLLHSLGAVRRNIPFLLFMGILVLCATPDKLAVPLEPIWLVDYLHLGYGEASFLLGTVVSVSSVAGYFLWARALKRFNSFAVLSVVAFLFAARFASLALARSSAQLLPMSILSGLTNAGWDLVPIFCIITLADRSNFSLYIGFHTTLFGIRGIIGPSIGTFLYSSGTLSLSGIFWVIAAFIACGAGLLMAFSRRQGTRASARIRVS
jgi:hypothetical protein